MTHEDHPWAEAPARPVPFQRVGPSPAMPELAGWSPVVRRAGTTLRAAAEERRPGWVRGEPGVGKATLVRLVAARALPGRNLVVLPATAAAEAASHLERGAPVLVRGVEPDPDLCALVAEAGARAAEPGRGWLALTERVAGDQVGASAAPAGAAVVTVPPLRTRPDDLAHVAPLMLRRHSSGREVTLSSSLAERLGRERWPDNLAGLDRVLAVMARSTTRAVLDTTDLPPWLDDPVRRRLTPMEWLTRDAIVTALRATEGDKDAAAAYLGLSRASIYRKIKALDIRAAEFGEA